MTRGGRQRPCPSREEQLSALLDGDLEAERDELEAHLEGCAGCRAGLEELRALRGSLRGLGSLEPPPELFDAVAAAVSRRRRRVAMVATAGLAAAGLVALVVSLVASRPPAPSVGPRVEVPVTLAERAESELLKAETHYRLAIGMLRQLAEADKPLWPAERRLAYEADLRMLDRSLQETRLLVRRAPTDPTLQEMLFASYRTQIDYLRDVLNPPRPDADDSI